VARKPPPHGKKRTSWKPGQSGNPKGGRPKSEHTWGAIFTEIGNLTGKAAAKRCHSIAGQLAGIGDAVTLKEAVAMRVYSALMFEPSGSLLEKVMDRMEGKLPFPMNVSWREEAEKLGVPASEVFEKMVSEFATRLSDAD
jgi:hypothetical protein